MEGEAAAAVLQALVQNLIDLCKKEISQIRGLDKDAAKLAASLKTIQNFLNDAEKRDITSEAVKGWLENLENVAVRDAPQGSWVLLNKLMSLSLYWCGECEEIPMLGHLPNLKSLRLWGLWNLKCINSSFYGMVNNDTRIVFPALERFELKWMANLAEWAEIEISDGSEVKLFPRLQRLVIFDCPQLMSVPSHVSSCLQHLSIYGIGVECLPADWLLSNIETLSKLYIIECPNLREISDRLGEEESEGRSFPITSLPIFPRLTKLIIDGVPKLSVETVDAMRRLKIHGFNFIYP